MAELLVHHAGDAQLTVDPSRGSRLTSLILDGRELLLRDQAHPLYRECYVMAPWAGRIRHGRARYEERERQYPKAPDGHALHGLVHERPWSARGAHRFTTRVEATEWFGPLDLEHRIDLHPDRLELTLVATAPVEPVPVTLGWHPWFRRRLGDAEVVLDLPAAWMLARDDEGIATTRRAAVGAEPWDDAFGGLSGPVCLTWPGVLSLEIISDAPVTVVFTGNRDGVCVEPQSGPPDEVNTAPRLAAPGDPVTLRSTWRWSWPDDPHPRATHPAATRPAPTNPG